MTRVRAGSDPLRVGLVGYGLGGAAFHAPFIATTPGLELSAIVTRDPERQRRVAHDYPTVHVLADAQDLWAERTELDVVVISTPNRTHVPLALAAINAGLHVVVRIGGWMATSSRFADWSPTVPSEPWCDSSRASSDGVRPRREAGASEAHPRTRAVYSSIWAVT